jgi:Ca-activated chloride channel homolog
VEGSLVRVLHPEMAVWLGLIPVAAACWTLHYAYTRRQRRRAGAVGSPQSCRTRPSRDVAALATAVIVLLLLAGAMMQPQIRSERRTPVFDRRDLVLILDRSVSMRARDIRPSRFARAVEEIQTFLRAKPEAIDRIALVGFSSTAVVLSYPTDDLASIFFYLEWVRDDPTALFGTDIGSALVTALASVKRDPQRVPPTFVLVSDGDDQGTRLPAAIAAVSRAGIRVDSIGIGSAADVPMPVATGDGREEYLRNDEGQVLTTRFDERTLERVAAQTGGRYFRSTTGGELRTALESIGDGERRQTGWRTAVDYHDVYLPLLAAAAALSVGLVALL